MSEIVIITDIDLVRADEPEMVYYGAQSPWWTHRAMDLRTGPNGVPCDPLGGVLLQTDKVDGFLRNAEENAVHYGRHGLLAFIAAHHGNCVTSYKRHGITALPEWDDYNDALDRMFAKYGSVEAALHAWMRCSRQRVAARQSSSRFA